jgi:hypothetical protein
MSTPIDPPAGTSLSPRKRFFRASKRDFTTAPGRTYFFLAKNSERSKAVTGGVMIGGLTGALVASAITAGNANPGPVDLYPLDEGAARTTLAGLQLAE